MKISNETFDLANKRGAQKQPHYPAAAAVKYDPGIARLVIDLASGLGLTIPLEAVQGLEDAVPADLADAEISPSGLGIYFPKLDTDIYLPALLEGVLGTKRWMAARNGKAGGKASTEAKAAAARENGKLGGRPKKKPDESPAG
jgi:hypothetical protein